MYLWLHKYRFFLASCAGHISLVLCVLCMFMLHQQAVVQLGGERAPIISSYVYQPHVEKSIDHQRKQYRDESVSEVTVPRQPDAIALKKQQVKKSVTQQEQVTEAKRANGNGEPIPELVALLHEAIQRQQHYPDSAVAMEREGRITLMFTLYATGQVEHVRVVRSSGTTILDEAALAAVKQAAPFAGVQKYLRGKEEYQIDVVFELT